MEGLMWQGMQEVFRSWKRLLSDRQEGNETCPYNHKELNLANNLNDRGSRFISREEYSPTDTLGSAEPCYTTTSAPQKCERISGCLMRLGLWWFFIAAMENSDMYSILKSGMYLPLQPISIWLATFQVFNSQYVSGYHIGQYRSRPREIKISRKC